MMRMINCWNALPKHVVDAPSTNAFKDRLDIHWADMGAWMFRLTSPSTCWQLWQLTSTDITRRQRLWSSNLTALYKSLIIIVIIITSTRPRPKVVQSWPWCWTSMSWSECWICSSESVSWCFAYRFQSDIRGDIHYSSERQPSCRRATTDYQRVDPDAEEGHWRWKCGDVQAELGGIPWRVWISGRQRQLLAGTGQDPPSRKDGQCQTQGWGIENKSLIVSCHPCTTTTPEAF